MLLTQVRHVFYIALATADGNSEKVANDKGLTVPGITAWACAARYALLRIQD